MTQGTPIHNLKGCLELDQTKRLIAAAANPRDQAFIALISRSGVLISEAIQIVESDIDFAGGTLTIVHLKKKLILKCPNCGDFLRKQYHFCPGCGEKVSQAIQEEIEQRHQRTIPIDNDTLALIKKYLRWRRQFPYRGPLLFPFTRQRGWQLVERIRRRTRTSSEFSTPFAGQHPGR